MMMLISRYLVMWTTKWWQNYIFHLNGIFAKHLYSGHDTVHANRLVLIMCRVSARITQNRPMPQLCDYYTHSGYLNYISDKCVFNHTKLRLWFNVEFRYMSPRYNMSRSRFVLPGATTYLQYHISRSSIHVVYFTVITSVVIFVLASPLKIFLIN